MERLTKKRLKEFENAIAYSFKDKKLAAKALTHKSFSNEAGLDARENNERLEFLGDAVLELVISQLLMEKFSKIPEGDLSKMRAGIVNEKQLADMARQTNLGDFILLGKGEEQTGGREKSSLLSDAYEALFGAIYLDRGFKKAYTFIRDQYEGHLPSGPEHVFYQDYKTLLQERSQSIFKQIPKYRMVKEHGPDHDKTFEVNLFIKDKLIGVGTGKSKKESEQDAARMALEQIEGDAAASSPSPVHIR